MIVFQKISLCILFVFLSVSSFAWDLDISQFPEVNFPDGDYETYELWFPNDTRYPKCWTQNYVDHIGDWTSTKRVQIWSHPEGMSYSRSFPPLPTTEFIAIWRNGTPGVSHLSEDFVNGYVGVMGDARFDFWDLQYGQANAEGKSAIGIKIVGVKENGEFVDFSSQESGVGVKVDDRGDEEHITYTGGSLSLGGWPPTPNITVNYEVNEGDIDTYEEKINWFGSLSTYGAANDVIEWNSRWYHSNLVMNLYTHGCEFNGLTMDCSSAMAISTFSFNIQNPF